jgi:hypothetical protein
MSWWKKLLCEVFKIGCPNPPPPAPPERTVAFGIQDQNTLEMIPGADVTLDGTDTDWSGETNEAGYVAFDGVPESLGHSHFWVDAGSQYEFNEGPLIIPPGNQQFAILMTPKVALERLRMEQNRFIAGNTWFVPRFYSCLIAPRYMWTGQVHELRRLFERARAARCNGIRIFGMLDWADIKYSPRDSMYWVNLSFVVELAAEYGLYTEISFFCDAQRIVPDWLERMAWASTLGEFAAARPTVIVTMANEARKNGWKEADDPALLDLARRVKIASPSTLVGVSDPLDPDRKEDVPMYNERQLRIAAVADFLLVHKSR